MDTITSSGATIKLANGSNCSLLITEILDGGVATDHLAMENLVFDGNGANQTIENTEVKFHDAWIGSWVRNVLIKNVFGAGISFSDGSDVQVDHLWVIGCYTDGYTVEINKAQTTGQGGYLNFNQLYIENTMIASYKGQSVTTVRTDENARGKAILINRAAS